MQINDIYSGKRLMERILSAILPNEKYGSRRALLVWLCPTGIGVVERRPIVWDES